MDLIALAPRGFERPLQEECGDRVLEQRDRIFVLRGHEIPLFAQNVWLKPQKFEFKSIGEAAKHLRSIQRNWWLHSLTAHRRAKLIAEGLAPMRPKPWSFMAPLPKAGLGSFTLFDEQTLIYSSECTSLFPDGELEFIENKADPPSRAYLKLWEFFTLYRCAPRAGETVIDLGSSPGGWTWVLDQLGCNVISVDKAPLSPDLKPSSRVQFVTESAFALEPRRVDWLFSDVICYPERLLDLVNRWQGFAKNFVCTIKFQGPTDFESLRRFLAIPGSRAVHLHANKHELTWFLLSEREPG